MNNSLFFCCKKGNEICNPVIVSFMRIFYLCTLKYFIYE